MIRIKLNDFAIERRINFGTIKDTDGTLYEATEI